jgi:hypothetical protein
MIESNTINCGFENKNGFGPYYTINNLIIKSLDFNKIEIKIKSNDEEKRVFVLNTSNFKEDSQNILKIKDSQQYPYFDFIVNDKVFYTQKHIFSFEVKFIFNSPKTEEEVSNLYHIESLTMCDK